MERSSSSRPAGRRLSPVSRPNSASDQDADPERAERVEGSLFASDQDADPDPASAGRGGRGEGPASFKTNGLSCRNSLGMHTYKKRARIPFRMHTCGTKDLKPFGMNTCRNAGEGGQHPTSILTLIPQVRDATEESKGPLHSTRMAFPSVSLLECALITTTSATPLECALVESDFLCLLECALTAPGGGG